MRSDNIPGGAGHGIKEDKTFEGVKAENWFGATEATVKRQAEADDTRDVEHVAFIPAPRYLVIIADPDEVKRDSGIIIQRERVENVYRGTISAIGADVENRELYSKGRRVIFGKYTGTLVTFDDEDYWLIEPDSVLGFLP
jgi:co-chaperonin GroES (HSP10)